MKKLLRMLDALIHTEETVVETRAVPDPTESSSTETLMLNARLAEMATRPIEVIR